MLLTEGWDCPSVDCIIVLRPTKVRSLYSQMVGRGTRLCKGKDHLLLLDFLWHTERHELCHPANLICENEEVAKKMTQNLETMASSALPEDVLEAIDIEEAEEQAVSDVVAQREESLAKQLAEMRKRKRKLVDPLQFEMSIMDQDLQSYVPTFGWEMAPASEKQIKALEKYGIYPDSVDNAGKATLLLDRLHKRQEEGLATPKQIRPPAIKPSINILIATTTKATKAHNNPNVPNIPIHTIERNKPNAATTKPPTPPIVGKISKTNKTTMIPLNIRVFLSL